MSIEIKNLSKKFNEVYAVKNVNFTIGTNKTIGLLGPNGCGKTTSIGMMLGLIKPTTGDIIIQNKNINTFERNKLLSIMNFVACTSLRAPGKPWHQNFDYAKAKIHCTS